MFVKCCIMRRRITLLQTRAGQHQTSEACAEWIDETKIRISGFQGHKIQKIGKIPSILHYAGVQKNFGGQGPWGPMWGTVGSGLTPGSRPDGRNWTHPFPDPENPEKPENPFPARFALLRPNQGTYRHGRGIHGSGLT